MPVIIASDEIHPFLPTLGSRGAIERDRAAHQDIRPLEIAILNLMADKMTTERQLATWLGNTPLQVNVTFIGTDRYVGQAHEEHVGKNTSSDHIVKFYKAWSSIKTQKFDGLIITGVNALQPRVSDEIFWPDVQEILDWSTRHVFSSLYLCWGAYAALKHFHNIESIKGETKTFGLFEHRLISDKTDLLFGFPDRFSIPVSRWKNPDAAAVAACTSLETVAFSNEVGPSILVSSAHYGKGNLYPHRVYVLNHPEYETDTLKLEYLRDHDKNPNVPLPCHYFPANDITQSPINSWRFTASLYSNWVKAIYEATPYKLADVPTPFAA
jgi:homoserine O-succinyltransferase